MNKNGFTLIELLVAVSIIGLLASIGVAEFSGYKQKANDTMAISNLRNAVVAEEAYFASNGQYVTCFLSVAPLCEQVLPGFVLNDGVFIEMSAQTPGGTIGGAPINSAFSGASCHSRGTTDNLYSWVSAPGGGLKPGVLTLISEDCSSASAPTID